MIQFAIVVHPVATGPTTLEEGFQALAVMLFAALMAGLMWIVSWGIYKIVDGKQKKAHRKGREAKRDEKGGG